MSAIPCPTCVADGVDCPLLIDGECLHCGRHDTPTARRIENAAFRARFASDSIRWRLRTTRARLAGHAHALVNGVLGYGR